MSLFVVLDVHHVNIKTHLDKKNTKEVQNQCRLLLSMFISKWNKHINTILSQLNNIDIALLMLFSSSHFIMGSFLVKCEL